MADIESINELPQVYQPLASYILHRHKIGHEKLRDICSYFQPLKAHRKELLIDYDETCKVYYFINSGCLRLFTVSSAGVETSRYFAFDGMFVTALPSFIDQRPALEYLQAIEKSELLVISRKDFFQLVDTVPEFSQIYREILELGFVNAQKRIYGFQGFNALEKVKWVIESQPNFLLRVSNKMAASYLGISPSTLSRTKSRL
ncbi:Crp/Fnr family transcriptional regulator [Dyadobacter sp. CY345]|uniref:Crp/Fnr family transcriptional regulator n=1 Tax=Dyadobacter sp. CY345 TaxID=2909335 RepID=UPI001F285534|nr:Crp/Fnr family transcriptional regulator [Dyadobacter sp. CY345]MCF2445055.1 Crp/Fnr family transcriptional regulator [Dyadobacter sp. CY345]